MTIAFVVLVVYLLERCAAVIPAGMALGLDLSIKIVPVIFLSGLVYSRAPASPPRRRPVLRPSRTRRGLSTPPIPP